MKLTTLTTTALLGAALVATGQVQNQENQDSAIDRNIDAPGQTQTTPGQAGTTPGQAGTTPAQDDSAPGQAGTTPGQSGNTPGQDRSADARMNDQGLQQGETFRDEINLEEAPASVRSVFSSHAMGGDLEGDVRHLTIEGKDVYVAEADQDEGENLHIYATADGRLLKTQQEVELESAPQAVQTALEDHLQNENDISRLLREMRDGKTSFIAEIDRNDQNDLRVHVDESGSVIKTWEDSRSE